MPHLIPAHAGVIPELWCKIIFGISYPRARGGDPGFVARGVCARYEITFNEDENTTTDLLNGKITFHQYITPFTPAEDIEDIIEFDPNALSAALN